MFKMKLLVPTMLVAIVAIEISDASTSSYSCRTGKSCGPESRTITITGAETEVATKCNNDPKCAGYEYTAAKSKGHLCYNAKPSKIDYPKWKICVKEPHGGDGGTDFQCGRDPKRIVGGSETGAYSLPWQVGLVHKNGRTPWCGGTIISNRHILTAAHCTDGKGLRFDVVVGEHDTTGANDGTIHKVSRVVEHPSYSGSTLDFDFAILTLETPISFGTRANAACLPTRSWAGDFLVGKKLTVSGWGHTSQGGSNAAVLHSVKVPGISNSRCNNLYNGEITSQMICAGIDDGGIDSCQNDSGGPLTYSANGGPTTVVGVVSWGIGCAQKGRPGVYARVTSVMGWIKSNMN